MMQCVITNLAGHGFLKACMVVDVLRFVLVCQIRPHYATCSSMTISSGSDMSGTTIVNMHKKLHVHLLQHT